MTMRTYNGGAWKTLSSGQVYFAGVWRRLTRAKGYFDGAWRELAVFVLPVSASASPTDLTGYDYAGYLTEAATVSVAGGQAPFSYAWTVGSSTASGATAATPSSATTRFYASSDGDTSFVCTVTDAIGQTAATQVAVTFVSFS